MDTEFVRILSRNISYSNVNINFSKAIASDDKNGFIFSGSRYMMNYLRQKLGDEVPFLIDFSAIPSSYKNDGKLADFITIYDPDSSFVENSRLDSAFELVYGYLQKNSLGMFYHPGFFASPDTPKFYYSSEIGIFPEIDRTFNDGQKWYEENLDISKRLYFKNLSFPFSYQSYGEKTKDALKRKESLQERNNILLMRYNNYFKRFCLEKTEKRTHLLAVPLIGYPSKEKTESSLSFEGLGSIFVYFIKDNFDENQIEELANDLWFLGLQITYNSIFQIAMELADKAKKEAIKSAKSAIMSRNMSHNIGSHVMSYLKQHLSSVTNIIQDNILSNLITAKEIDDLNSIYRSGDFSAISGENDLFIRLILRIINETYIPDEEIEYFIDKVHCNDSVDVTDIAGRMKVDDKDINDIIEKHSDYFASTKVTNQSMRDGLYQTSEDSIINETDLEKSIKDELIKRRIYKKVSDKESAISLVKKLTKFTKTGDDVALPFLVGMGNFLSYIQERQDFIATIATDYIPYFASINFKDFIYDEINPDKRFERHKDRKNLQPDNILLGNIARSEGLGRTIQTTSKRSGQLSDIVIIFQDSRGHVFDGEPVVNSSNVTIAGRESAYEALEAMRKLEISLPGGVIGRQAIFSIVENIIRNTAKHGNWRNQGRLELAFNFYDKDSVKDFDRLKQRGAQLKEKKTKEGCLNDTEQVEYNQIIEKLDEYNRDASQIESLQHWEGRHMHLSLMEVLWHFYIKSSDADDLYYVTITDNVPISESSVKKLREALTEDYIDEESKMKEGNKGIKEIRISSAWLRGAKNEEDYYNSGVDLEGGQQTKKKAPLVYVRQHNGCLQYIICLQKPRMVAVITREPLSEAAINTLKARGWRYYIPENYIKERNKSYRFTICEDRDLYDKIRPFSSSRVYVLDRVDFWEKIRVGISEEDSKNLERYLYDTLVPDKATIWIDDDKAKGNMSFKICEDKNYAVKEAGAYYQVKDVDVRVIDGCHSHVDYIYRKHHDTLEQFTSFMKVNPNGCKFVESITGDTSTDRLVRNEKYDFRWYYSHLNAMRKKVAIFDERLFSRIYGLEEADFTKGSVLDLDELKNKYCEQNPVFKGLINDCKTIDDLYKTIKELGLNIIKESRSDVYTKDYVALTYFQKGICFYTLIKDSVEEPSKKKSFGVYGLYFDRNDCSLPKHKDNYTCRCERVATMTWTGQTIDVDFDASSKKYIENQFDFISIHQGLLDKLYEAFDIKYCKEKKIQLTTMLIKRFGNNLSDNHEWKLGFVPGMIVHSGRSKPAESDMPQMLPFIQYASIENAVLDCKYSLIDLLENARYEQ